MAFYRDVKSKTRQEKRQIAENRGGFDDEGSRYRGAGARDGGRTFGGKQSRERAYGDRPRGGKPYGNKPAGERPYGGKPAGERPYGGKPAGERPYGERSYDDRPRGGKPYGNKPAGERPYGERPRTDRPYGNKPAGERPYGNKPAGERPYGDRPNAGRSFDDRPRGGKPYGNKPAGERPYGERPYGDRPNAGRSFDDRPRGGKPYGNKPAGERPYGEHPYGDRPNAGRSFDDRPRGGKPYGNKPAGERPYGAPPRMNPSATGEYRVSHSPDKYTERGSNAAPRPYGEQRRARDEGERRFERFRYAPPAPASYAPIDNAELDSELVPNENLLCGRNPIREALKSGRDIEKLLVQRGELSGSARELVQMARERRIPVQEVDKARLDAIAQSHQGMLAFASAYKYSTVEDMLALAAERGEKPFIVLLDGITDPHNLGAIIRTAECAGAHGVIVQERRAVGLTPAAVKASAGAVEYVPVARVTNLGVTIDELKKQGIWTYAADMSGESYEGVDFDGGVALVIGAEGEGVSRLVLEKCDKAVSLPIKGKLDSLNASVAAGVLLYAIMRAR